MRYLLWFWDTISEPTRKQASKDNGKSDKLDHFHHDYLFHVNICYANMLPFLFDKRLKLQNYLWKFEITWLERHSLAHNIWLPVAKGYTVTLNQGSKGLKKKTVLKGVW